MNRPIKLLLVAGARPNFMKIAPLIHALKRRNAAGLRPEIEWRLVHTGQHYDAQMSDVFFTELRIPKPDFCLEVGSASHALQVARVLERFEPVCLDYRPDWVVVVGDVNSTLACALAATKLGIKVAHIEAGLRSFDRTMPEEVNRLMTDAIADLLLTPSPDGDENLRREGIPESRIRCVGNIMIDALVQNLPAARQNKIMENLQLEREKFIYVTLHRPANVDAGPALRGIITALQNLSDRMTVVFPVHPRTRKMIETHGISLSDRHDFRMIDPVGYHQSLCLTENARLVATDSGGLQEESTYFRTPCLTLRPNTERPVTISLGSNRLSTPERLQEDLDDLMAKPSRMGKIPPLWDGNTADRIVEVVAQT